MCNSHPVHQQETISLQFGTEPVSGGGYSRDVVLQAGLKQHETVLIETFNYPLFQCSTQVAEM